MFDYTILQNNLHRLRIESCCSQAELSQKLGLSRHTYLNYETGIRVPTLEAMRRISAHYNVGIDDLLNKPMDK